MLLLQFSIITKITFFIFFTDDGQLNGKIEIEIGLWRVCLRIVFQPWKNAEQPKQCIDVDEFSQHASRDINKFGMDDKFKTIRAFSILSIIASVVTFVAACFVAVEVFGNTKTICVGLAISCVCQLLALAMFTILFEDHMTLLKKKVLFNGHEHIQLGWSYALGWIGCALTGTLNFVVLYATKD